MEGDAVRVHGDGEAGRGSRLGRRSSGLWVVPAKGEMTGYTIWRCRGSWAGSKVFRVEIDIWESVEGRESADVGEKVALDGAWSTLTPWRRNPMGG